MEYVYIIQAEETNWLKIGRSNNPQRRSDELSAKAPYETKILLSIPTPNARALEKYIHWQYSEFRTRGEWFALTGSDKAGLVGCYTELTRDNPVTGVTDEIAKSFFDVPF